MSESKRKLLTALGLLAFALGWLGVLLPGLPTTIFWILAATAFIRTNPRLYEKVVAHPRFGPGVRRFVEEGTISRRGKLASISAMMLFATIGALAMPPLWLKILVLGLAASGSTWVALIPAPERRAARAKATEALERAE